MKRWLIWLSLLVAVGQNCAAEVEWLTDYSMAMKRAKLENKIVLLDFTGSDWCGWCMRLKSEVFDQPEFAAFAQKHLVMLEVDFPHHHSLSARQEAANDQLAADYHIEGYPSIVLLNADGGEVGRSGYQPGGAQHFINDLVSRIPALRGATVPAPAVAEAAPKPAAVVAPVPPAAPNHSGELSLKGISGAKDRRLVLINNQTLMTGETASVKVRDGHVEVTCKEIHDNSALVVVDGQEQKLILGGN